MSVLDLGADTVYVVPPTTPTVVAAPPTSSAAPVVVVAGPAGAPGQQGPEGSPSVQWFHGNGPPVDPIMGSHSGDFYIDDLTGVYYQQS